MQHPPTLRLIQVPDGSPPYDSETDRPSWSPRRAPASFASPGCGGPERPSRPGDSHQINAARQLAQAIIETVAGIRPLRQIIPATTERVQAQIRGLIRLFRTDGKPRIQRILASPTSPDVVEVTVIAGFGPRTRAVAMRFERLPARLSAPGLGPRPARWLCTDLETP